MPAARHARYGPLDCIVVDTDPKESTAERETAAGTSPKVGVILCHGYGAPGHDLAGLSAEWIHLLGDDAHRFRFFFPAAPYSLAELGMPDGRAWWPINMAQLAAAAGSNDFDALYEQEPPGLSEVRIMLCETVTMIQQELGDEDTQLVLGGFSQGAMLTMDLSLRGKIDPPRLLLLFSGMLICRPQWQEALPKLSDTHVYQSHGTIDPILPFSGAQSLHDLLREGGIDAQFHSFMGPHTIDPESIATTAMAMKQLISSSKS